MVRKTRKMSRDKDVISGERGKFGAILVHSARGKETDIYTLQFRGKGQKVIVDTGRMDGKMESLPFIESRSDAYNSKPLLRQIIKGQGLSKATIKKLGL